VPKELTHCLFADRALAAYGAASGANPAFADLLRRRRVPLHMGAVMVDSYFYALRAPPFEAPFPAFGDKIHGAGGEDTARLPLAMLEAARATEDRDRREERLAFAAGFLTHVALDSVLHPFVYNVTGNYYATDPKARDGAMTRHRLLESWLDLHVLGAAGLDVGTNGLFEAIRRSPSGPHLRTFYAAATDLALGLPTPAAPALARGWALQSFANRIFPRRPIVRALAWLNRRLDRRFDPYLSLCYDWKDGRVPAEIVDFGAFRHPITGERCEGGIARLLGDAEARARDYLSATADFAAGGSVEAFRRVVTGLSLDFGMLGSRSADATHFDLIPDVRLWPPGEAAD